MEIDSETWQGLVCFQKNDFFGVTLVGRGYIDGIKFYVKVESGGGDIFESLLFLKYLEIFEKKHVGVCFCEW